MTTAAVARRLGARWSRALAVAGAMLVAAPPAGAHDLHTTYAEVSAGRDGRTVRVVIRVFANDLAQAIHRSTAGRAPMHPGAEALAYLRAGVTLSVDGRALPLSFCGTRRSGDLRWLCLETVVPPRTGGLQLRNVLLTELFDDQVNIVRSFLGAAPRSLLFTRGAGAKSLR